MGGRCINNGESINQSVGFFIIIFTMVIYQFSGGVLVDTAVQKYAIIQNAFPKSHRHWGYEIVWD